MAHDLSLLAVLRTAFSLRWTIVGRLTRHYFLATAVLLLGASFYLYYGLRHSLDMQNHALVASKVKVLRVLLEEHVDDPRALRSEIEHEAGEESVLRYYLRVLDAEGHMIVETPGMGARLPVDQFPPPGMRSDPLLPAKRTIRSGHDFLIGSALAGRGDDPAARRILHVALDVSPNEDTLQRYRNQLASAFGLGSMLAAIIGAAVARASLRPLDHIARATQHTTARKLNRRIASQPWPKELTMLAAEFDRMLDRLEDSFRRLEQCTGDMAHALRNPINNLRGEAEVLLQRPRPPQEYQQALMSALEEYDRLARMIDGLLFIARADDVTAALERRSFPARVEMDAVRDFYDALASDRGVRVVCEGDATLCADPMLVRRALSNLLGNALKHTPAGGTVTLAARSTDPRSAEIAVTDTGEGIPPELAERVFERFFQVDKSRDGTAKGAGLGLAIVQSIMRLHGGEVALSSVLGRGTTVVLRFRDHPDGPAGR